MCRLIGTSENLCSWFFLENHVGLSFCLGLILNFSVKSFCFLYINLAHFLLIPMNFFVVNAIYFQDVFSQLVHFHRKGIHFYICVSIFCDCYPTVNSVTFSIDFFLRCSNYKKNISPENGDDNISSLEIFMTLILSSCLIPLLNLLKQ